MNTSSILAYLGFSIHHEEVQKFLDKYELAELNRPHNSQGLQSTFGMNPGQYYGPTEFKNEALGIHLSFAKKKSFLSEYKHLRFEKYPEDKGELILSEITIEPKDNKLGLPLKLDFLMPGESIKALLGQPLSEMELFGQIKWEYRIKNYKIILSLNADYQLLWLRAWLIDLHTYWAEEREVKLANYDPNIHELTEAEAVELRKLNPSSRWKGYNDDIFEELSEAEKDEKEVEFRRKALDFFTFLDSLFEEYLKMISKYAKEQNAKLLYETLKTTIRKFNEWNEIHGYIMTMEREGICEFLEIILKNTGFEIHEDEDITLVWRKW